MSRAIRQLAARKNLTPGLLTQFLREHEFPIIEEHIRHNIRQGGEIQLTTALDELRKERGGGA